MIPLTNFPKTLDNIELSAIISLYRQGIKEIKEMKATYKGITYHIIANNKGEYTLKINGKWYEGSIDDVKVAKMIAAQIIDSGEF